MTRDWERRTLESKSEKSLFSSEGKMPELCLPFLSLQTLTQLCISFLLLSQRVMQLQDSESELRVLAISPDCHSPSNGELSHNDDKRGKDVTAVVTLNLPRTSWRDGSSIAKRVSFIK